MKDDVAYVFSSDFSAATSRVQRFSLSNGATLSDVTLPAYYYSGSIDPVTGLLVVQDNRILLIDPVTGAVLHSVLSYCGSGACGSTSDVMLSADGTVRTARNFSVPGRGSTVRVDAYGETAALPNIRVDQPGLDGAWYYAASPGQGFTIDYVAGAKVFFMTWFTYGIDDVNDPDELAWTTMQGTIEPGATEANLTLVRSLPGVFDSGTVGSRVAGTARLTFTDCNTGSLDVRFDHDDFFGTSASSIPIARLSPTTSSCILANGTTQPAQNANAPKNGFDARQSGSWYEPATSGQGIELTIVPAGNAYAGLVYGAWFTFDPAPANDPQHEHWFTLQGDLSGAANGTVSLPIYQVFGSSILGRPTSNINRVGTATLTLSGCDTGTLAYRFDDSDVAHDFAGLSGTIALSKIAGCSAQ